jgi:hypothetical protein
MYKAAHLTPNEAFALYPWILLMAVATAASWNNARKNAGKPLGSVWRSMTLVCGWWLLSAIIGLLGGPFKLLYRLGILFAAIAVFVHYRRGDFRMD